MGLEDTSWKLEDTGTEWVPIDALEDKGFGLNDTGWALEDE